MASDYRAFRNDTRRTGLTSFASSLLLATLEPLPSTTAGWTSPRRTQESNTERI